MLAAPARADIPGGLSAYVKARAADADGRVDVAAAGYAAALAAAPGNPVIAVRAYREGLASGDVDLARRAANALAGGKLAPPDTAMLAIADGVRARDWAAVDAATARLSGGPLDFLGPVVRAWVAHERKSGDAAALLAGETDNGLARRFNAENRALLLIAQGDEDQGIALLRTLLGASAANLDLRVNAAQLLAAKGRGKEARALLAGPDPVLAGMRDTLGKGVKPDAAFGISRLFDRLGGDVAGGDARALAIVLARASLILDPRDDRARLILAEALSREKLAAHALAALDRIEPRGPFAAAALSLRVSVLNRSGDGARALAAASQLSDVDGADSEAARRVGDLLIAAGRYDDAAGAFATAIARAGDDAGWVLFLQRGGALEQAGKWDEARAMLERAVALAPDQAVALNYLGYAQLERGENIDGARALLERASKLQPDDAAITDSLGWAYVQSGMVAKGVPLLERAARAEPADVTIQEHLGDAYWRLGRRYEARYAWRAAAVYAEGEDAARLAGKLADGETAAR